MNGYLMFLKSLSEYQQRAEIGRLAFSERWADSSLEEDILQDQAVSSFSETLGVNPRFWKFDLRHYAEEPDLFGAPGARALGSLVRSAYAFIRPEDDEVHE